jgi:hypothetical protein
MSARSAVRDVDNTTSAMARGANNSQTWRSRESFDIAAAAKKDSAAHAI